MKHKPIIPSSLRLRRRLILRGWPLTAAIGLGLVGCRNSPPTRPLSSAAFYQGDPEPSAVNADQSGRAPSSDLQPRPSTVPLHDETTVHSAGPATKPESAAPATQAASQPDPSTDQVGGYLTLGAVLAEVNGKAIYANEIFADIADSLHKKALQLDPAAYRTAAGDLIRQTLNAHIGNELAYTAAERFLSKDEKSLADMATERWRRQRITEAGGSLQLARTKARADGQDFDAMVRRQAKLFTIDVYREKKILPKVQVTVQDMRQYYQHNQEKLYTRQPAAHFLLIEIDPQRSGGRDEALKKIRDIRRRAVGGENFGALAHDMSDSALLRTKNGDVGWVDKGAFRLEAVEKAAWAMQPGDVSDVIETDGAFYLVKLLALQKKTILPFDNEQVQSEIRQTLRSRQMAQLLEQAERTLRDNAAVSENPQAMSVTLEMAMQKYAQWRRGRLPSQGR